MKNLTLGISNGIDVLGQKIKGRTKKPAKYIPSKIVLSIFTDAVDNNVYSA